MENWKENLTAEEREHLGVWGMDTLEKFREARNIQGGSCGTCSACEAIEHKVNKAEKQAKNQVEGIHVRNCRLDKNDYALSIDLLNRHTSVNSHPYDQCSDNRSNTSIAIFNLTPDDIIYLGRLITEQGVKAKGGVN